MVIVAILISLSWTWSSIEVMQQNYELQQNVDAKKHQLALEKLRVETLELESKYYDTVEYQELAVRERLGKGLPGEQLLIVPSTDELAEATTKSTKIDKKTNLQEWMSLLFGNSQKTKP